MLSRVGRIVGIVTPMDINSNIVGKGLDPNATLVSTIMTPKPDMVSPDTTVFQALRKASLSDRCIVLYGMLYAHR